MNKIVIAVAITGIILVGCSSQASPAPTVTVTQNAPAPSQDDPPAPEPEVSNEDLYLISIKSMNNALLNRATDRELLDMGYAVCDALNAGYTVNDVIAFMAAKIAEDGGASDTYVEAVGYIIGAADLALCPGSNTF